MPVSGGGGQVHVAVRHGAVYKSSPDRELAWGNGKGCRCGLKGRLDWSQRVVVVVGAGKGLAAAAQHENISSPLFY